MLDRALHRHHQNTKREFILIFGSSSALSTQVVLEARGSCFFSLRGTHVTDPLGEGGGAGEHRGLQGGVAPSGGDEAGHPLHIPPPVATSAVQRASGVSLQGQTDRQVDK